MWKRRREAVKESRVNHMKLLLRWVCASIAIFVAVKLLPDIRFEGPWRQFGIVALILGLLNALEGTLIASYLSYGQRRDR
jgi:hypothetical protein